MLVREPSLHDRSDGVYHIVTGQVVGRRDLRLACGFFVTLRFHDLTALVPQTHPRKGVYAVVDTRVAGLPAPGHSRIGGVDYRTASERGNITFPEINAVLYWRQICNNCDTLALGQGCEIFVLGLQIILVCLDSRADIHNYRGKSRSLSNSQILFEDYDVDSAHIVMKEMVENLVLELVENNLYTKGISLYIRYSKDCIPATGGNMKLEQTSCSIRKIQTAFDKLYIDKVKIGYGICQIGIALTDLTYEPDMQLSFFENHEDDENEMQLEVAMVGIRNKYGKNALLKGFNLFDKATGIKRNTMVGGHNG